MSGRNSLCLWVFALVFAGVASSQVLPDIPRFDADEIRVVILDNNGKRRGELTAKSAKRLDKTIELGTCKLLLGTKESNLTLTAEQFSYVPKSGEFSVPEGVSATFPDGATIVVPTGKGSLKQTDTGITLTLVSEGRTTVNSGKKTGDTLTAQFNAPTITSNLNRDGQRLALQSLTVAGQRGCNAELKSNDSPNIRRGKDNIASTVTVSCFGPYNVALNYTKQSCDVDLLRRCEMTWESKQDYLTILSSQLRVRGALKTLTQNKRSVRVVRGLNVDAENNVHVTGNGIDGYATRLSIKEKNQSRELRLEHDAQMDVTPDELETLDIDDEPDDAPDDDDESPDDDDPQEVLELRASNSITLTAPLENTQRLDLTLLDGARIRRTGTDYQWLISGERTDLTLTENKTKTDGKIVTSRDYKYSVIAEGYAPMLTLQSNTGAVSTASVYGTRASGTASNTHTQATILGPRILSVVNAKYALAREMRVALGLRKRRADESPTDTEGQLVTRSNQQLDLLLTRTENADPDLPPIDTLDVRAVGSVQIDHQPTPRNDDDLVTLTGETVDLAMRGRRVSKVEVTTESTVQPAMMTLGYDLLDCAQIAMNSVDDKTSHSVLTGPGRFFLRDSTSLSVFEKKLNSLPVKVPNRKNPDSGRIYFDSLMELQSDATTNSLVIRDCNCLLVYGDFQPPRAGRSGFKDVDELNELEVIDLYRVEGTELVIQSVKESPDADRVNVLRLSGSPLIHSIADDFKITCDDAVEIVGADSREHVDAPLTVLVLGNARVVMGDSERFLGANVQRGIFSYDGQWTLTAKERLEITRRPSAFGGDLVDIRRQLFDFRALNLRPIERLGLVSLALRDLEALLANREPENEEQRVAWTALETLRTGAREYMRGTINSQTEGRRSLAKHAMRQVRRAERLLGGFTDVVAVGDVRAKFAAKESDVPLLLEAKRSTVVFDGVGDIVSLNAEGPVRATRNDYVLSGSRFVRETSGALRLDQASIKIAATTGVQISGIETVRMRNDDGTRHSLKPRRTMVTRISGKQLKVRVNLAETATDK